MEEKHYDSPVKKMFQEQRSVKKAMLTFFLIIKVLVTMDFLEKLQS